jgi:hypothetical protein
LDVVSTRLSVNTRRTYLGRIRQYCAYLETSANDYGNPLSDPHARDYAIRDFKADMLRVAGSLKLRWVTASLFIALHALRGFLFVANEGEIRQSWCGWQNEWESLTLSVS